MFRATLPLLEFPGVPRPRRRPNNYYVHGIYPQVPKERRNRETLSTGEKFGHPMPYEKRENGISRTMSYILRHHAKREGVAMRKDGFVRVDDLLSIPKMHSVDFLTLEKIVRDDNKNRYKMIQEISENGSIWWIRANQGHSIEDVQIDMEVIRDPSQIIMAVHGTTMSAWSKISHQGLSRRNRQHVHFAQGVPKSGVISGMRDTSQVLIYLDVEFALKHGLQLFLSANGVVLSPGDSNGFIHPAFFDRVEYAGNKQNVKFWERPLLPEWLQAKPAEVVSIVESEEANANVSETPDVTASIAAT